jgi:hypothetical protein
LIGGKAGDWIVPSDNDIHILGYTDFDDEVQALAAIQAEWTSDRSRSARIANLTGVGQGPRANGDVFLIDKGRDATVHGDPKWSSIF